ncbi:unnamed protein product [Blepharisma stoltei]|uniref:Uncharacterized protein n=1 Tax=Blepharisma stoltei TaxID=1481888 RepID=A0AAU9K4R4_9CILI|nr:unnamed protein product [Blepharisma stoltei]
MTRLNSMTSFLIGHLKPFHKRGVRKNTLESKIRSLFFTVKNFTIRLPKKEYLRCRVIRGHKRANRQIKKNTLPSKTINKLEPSNKMALEIWQVMTDCYHKRESEFDALSVTDKKPKHRAKNKRNQNILSTKSSFNTDYCMHYFASEVVRESFFYYVEFLFSQIDPEDLCTKFDFRCCKVKHDDRCYEKWLYMKKYLHVYMIEDLGLEPYMPQKVESFYLPALMTLYSKDIGESENNPC